MILSYKDVFEPKSGRKRIYAEIVTEGRSTSYLQSGVILEDGSTLDLFSWIAMSYRVVEATPEEREALHEMGLT